MIEHTINVLKDCNIEKYDICISCCLFKMKSAYRNFDKYFNKFTGWFRKIPKNSFVRLYIDISVLQDRTFMTFADKNHPNLQVILYDFPDFLESDGLFHDGTFGSITRFLALYDKKLLSKVKYIWITDVDVNSPKWFDLQYIRDLDTYKCDSSYYTDLTYKRLWVPDDIDFPIIANHLIVKTSVAKKLEIKYFWQFLENVLKHKFDGVMNDILEYYSREKSMRKIVKPEYFIYGFDELFLNTYIEPVLKANNPLLYIVINIRYMKKYLNFPFEKVLNEHENKLWQNKGTVYKKEFDDMTKLNDQIYSLMLKNKPKLNNTNDLIVKNIFKLYKKIPRKYHSHFAFGAIVKM